MKKKILFLAMNLGSGGAERQMITLARLMKKEGIEVSFLCYSEEDFYVHILKEENIPVKWMVGDNYLMRMIKVRRFVRKGKFDTVISFLHTPNFLNNFSAIGGKNWKIITGERSSNNSTFVSGKGKIFAWFQRYSDLIVCNSNNAKEMWKSYYPKYSDKLTTIYNPIILQNITAEYMPKRNNKLNIVIAASYQYLKNPKGLIEAINLMSNEEKQGIRIDWYGRKEVTTGNTQAYDETVGLINRYDLGNIIYLHGETKDIANKMQEADLVSLLSELEGLPNTICEGMMIGKPIIMSRVSDYNVLVDESNGFLCDWDNHETIKDAILKASKLSVGELQELGKASKEKAERLFSNEVIIKQWINKI